MGFQVTPIKGSKDKELVDENLVVSSPSKIM